MTVLFVRRERRSWKIKAVRQTIVVGSADYKVKKKRRRGGDEERFLQSR